MFGLLKKTIFLGVGLVALSIITPTRAAAQDCEICVVQEVCESATWRRICWLMGPPGYECVTTAGCEPGGGDPEQVAAADLRTLATPDGPHHVSRISEQYFGQWLTCNGWVTELWAETDDGELVPVEPIEVGLLYHPDLQEKPGL